MENKDILISLEEVSTKLVALVSNPEVISFIFGAGASRGYTTNSRVFLVPPMVTELFEDSNLAVKKVIHSAGHENILAQQYRFNNQIRKNPDLEEYLSKLYTQNSQLDLFGDLLIYLQDIFYFASNEIDLDPLTNNYLSLLYSMSELRNSSLPWSCISFNYDTILEKSLRATRWFGKRQFSTLDSYEEPINPKIIKVHGGINLRFNYKEIGSFPIRSHQDIFEIMMQKGKNSQGSFYFLENIDSKLPDFYDGSKTQWNQERYTNDRIHEYDFPVMMVPIHTTENLGNKIFEGRIESALNELKASSLVIAIGYNFGDHLFREKIKTIDTSSKELILVGIEDMLEKQEKHPSYKNISEVWKGPVRIFNGNGFASFISALPSA